MWFISVNNSYYYCNKGGLLPRTVSVTLTSPNWLFPEISQSYTPVSLRVTLENLTLLPEYIDSLPEYGSVTENNNNNNNQEKPRDYRSSSGPSQKTSLLTCGLSIKDHINLGAHHVFKLPLNSGIWAKVGRMGAGEIDPWNHGIKWSL